MKKWLLLLLLAAGCAGGPALRPDPVVAIDSEIAHFNDEELFLCGTAAWESKDYVRASRCFSRLADAFPQSRHARDAQFNAGAAYEAQGLWEEALARYRVLVDPDATGEGLDPLWRTATCLYQLDRYDEAIALLAPLPTRTELAPADRIHAYTYAGVCKVEQGELSKAELDFRKALDLYKTAQAAAEERIDDWFAAQAQFFLGEVYRLHFEAVRLQAVDDVEKLGEELEYKAQLLLSAQGHYLRAIRMGNVHWGTAAGQRVGGLYETLYGEMTNAPVPAGLDGEQAQLYRGLLRRKVRVLVQKAIDTYERTLSTAERVGVEGAFVEQTRQSLDRMKQVMLADAARDEAEGITDEDLKKQQKAVPPDADPGA